MKNYLKLARIANVVLIFLSVECGGILCDVDVVKSWKVLFAAFAAALIAAGGNVLNRLSDIEVEHVNERKKSSTSNGFVQRNAMILFFVVIIPSLVISAIIGLYPFMLALIASIMIPFYSLRLKRMVFFGNFTVALIAGLTFIYAGTAVGDFKNAYPAAIFTFLVNMIREIIKDARDFRIDSDAGIKTIATEFGTKVSAYLSISLTVLLLVMVWGVYSSGILPIQFLTVCGLTILPIGIYTSYLLVSRMGFSEASFGYKLMMVFGLVAFIVGKI